MKWYFAIRIFTVVLFVFVYGKAGLALDLAVFLLLLFDFIIFPIGYLIRSFFKRKKLAPGEYKIKPEGKRL